MISQDKKQPQKKLVLLAGQSNMSGRGYLTNNDITELPGITALRWDKVWIPAIAPFNYDRINQLGLNESQDPFEEKALEINNQRRCGVGPGRTFAKLLQEKFPGSEIGLIPVSVGGTAIDAWLPGGKDKYSDRHPYDDALAMARYAMQFGKIEVILWHQGESDAKFKTPDYKEKLITVINNFRRDLALEHVPVILGEIGYFLNEERFAVKEYNEYIRQAAAELANAGIVSAKGLTDRGDRVHFDTPSQYELAKRYFKEYCRLTGRKTASTEAADYQRNSSKTTDLF